MVDSSSSSSSSSSSGGGNNYSIIGWESWSEQEFFDRVAAWKALRERLSSLSA
jgi:hypothetical protein